MAAKCEILSLYSAYTLLKGFDKNGRRVFLFRIKDFNTDKYKVDNMNRLHFMIMEILMDSMDQSSVTGENFDRKRAFVKYQSQSEVIKVMLY